MQRRLMQAKHNPALLKEPDSYYMFLEFIGYQMSLQAKTQAEKAQLAKTNIDSVVLVESAGHLRRVLGIEVCLSSLAGATNIGELARLILIELYRGAEVSE